ncbi:MAG: sigma-54 dependent transcriptional regulator [Acidobacteria bacterium]|nr:sigma-54 dependent transcriptional regulator [Acidobacteriota bacterium]
MPNILIVDDDRDTCQFIAELLSAPGRDLAYESDPRAALERAAREPFDAVISDINLNAAQSGLDILRAAKSANPRCQVVLISGFGTLETAIEAVRAGAFDYISKPFNIAQVKSVVERALAQAASPEERPRDARVAPTGLIGRSAEMLDVYKQIAHAADAAAPVLIVGESGTGKELVAKAIHGHGRRAARPFVAINCGAIAETLLESELFGHMRGSFTGAVADSKGLLEQAHGGTVFLDEVGETSAALQVKLLRALEEGEIRPVGANRVVKIDVRVVAATNVELEQAVAAGRFRQDLYYRLSVVVIRVPPLRDRRADIPLLVDEFLRNSCARAGRERRLSAAALEMFLNYRWPGNVRELENTIERLVLFSPGTVIEVGDLPPTMGGKTPGVEQRLFADLPTLDEVERRYLAHVLDSVKGNRTRAADVMGIDRRTLYRMAERFGIDLKDEPGRQ